MRLKVFVLVAIAFSTPSLIFSRENLFLQSNAGITFPVEPQRLSDSWKNGLTVGGGVGYTLNNYFAIIGNVSYSYFGFSGKDLQLAIPPEYEIIEVKGEKSYLLDISINLRLSQFKVENTVRPFLSVGFGFLTQRIGKVEVSFWDFINDRDGGTTHLSGTGVSDKNFSLALAVGTEIQVWEKFAIFIEGSFLTTSNSDNLYLPVKVGIRF